MAPLDLSMVLMTLESVDEWKFASMDFGGQYVIMAGVLEMLQLCVQNLGFLVSSSILQGGFSTYLSVF